MYNFYPGSNPASCTAPTSGSTGNNGNVTGYYYVDNVNPGLNHAATYTYDAVNPLVNAVATGNSTYNQTYTYNGDGSNNLYGNMSCTPAAPGCVNFAYSAATNHITTSGYSYDAAGDITGDGTNTYQWDAEGHLISVIDGQLRTISANTYNALGQRVRDVTLTSTTDEAYGAGGNLLWRYTGNSTDPNQRAFVPFSGGILAEYYGGSPGGTIFDHPDEIGSATIASDYTGNNFQERLYFPFGEAWTGAGSLGMHQTFAQLPDYDPETDQYNTLNRHYTPSGRWMSPDPLGGHLEDPQTLNKYAYVRNNPTSLTDPTGLDFWLTCASVNNNGCTQVTVDGDGNKMWVQAGSNGAAIVVTSASLQDPNSGNTATVNENGVQITTANGTAQGIFISGTPAANGVQGSANLRGFSFDINGNDIKHGVLASGTWTYNGPLSLNEVRTLLYQRGSFTIPFEDARAGFGLGAHPFTTQHRFGGAGCSTLSCLDSPHLSVDYDPGTSNYVAAGVSREPKATVPVSGGFHVDAHGDWWGHFKDVTGGNPQ